MPLLRPPHHHQGVHLGGQFLNFSLPGGGGVADGIEDAGLGKAGFDFLDPGCELGAALGRLGHHDQFLEFGQRRHLLSGGDHVAPPLGVAQEPPHLRVVRVPDDEGGGSLAGPTPDDGLHPGDPGTGGVDDPAARILQLPAFLGRDAVGPDNHQPVGNHLPGVKNGDAPFPEEFQHLRVVDQRAVGEDPPLVLIDGF